MVIFDKGFHTIFISRLATYVNMNNTNVLNIWLKFFRTLTLNTSCIEIERNFKVLPDRNKKKLMLNVFFITYVLFFIGQWHVIPVLSSLLGWKIPHFFSFFGGFSSWPCFYGFLVHARIYFSGYIRYNFFFKSIGAHRAQGLILFGPLNNIFTNTSYPTSCRQFITCSRLGLHRLWHGIRIQRYIH